MLKIREAIVVEGKYDKITLTPLVDTEIFTTEGFGIFRNDEKMNMLRRIAQKRGLIVLTDSDGAGLVIRNRLKSCIPPQYLKHAYIPEIYGKERRKKIPSRAGTLGVEGMSADLLRDILLKAGITPEEGVPDPVTKSDFARLGLSGASNSSMLRSQLKSYLKLPSDISANALLSAVNSLYSRKEFYELWDQLSKDQSTELKI